MLVDTGASIVLLTYEDAEAAGLNPDELAFSQPVVTANGKAFVAPIRLDSVAIGVVGLSGVKAAVAERGKLHSSLLGMSFLKRLDFSQRGDTLIRHQFHLEEENSLSNSFLFHIDLVSHDHGDDISFVVILWMMMEILISLS